MNDTNFLTVKIENCVLPPIKVETGVIEFDLTEFKKQVKDLSDKAKELTLNVSNVDSFAKLRAKLNNFSKEINENKKTVKNKYLSVYNDFEKDIKEAISLIDSASKSIDQQVKDFEAQQMQILREELIELWKTFGKDSKVPFERIEKTNWYLKSSSKKKVLVEMQEINDKINSDLALLYDSVSNEKEYEKISESYFKSLDVALELGNYTKWKNIIQQEKIVVETTKEEVVKTIQEKEENAVETKFQVLNEGITHEGKQQQVIFAFTAEKSVVDYIENLLKENDIKYQLRRNEVR